MGTEVITYSRIGKEDIRFGKGTFEVVLADGRKAIINEVDVGAILNDTSISTVPSLFGWHNVKTYGAEGDGSHNDTAAFQAAIDAAGSGGRVFIPPGDYILIETLNVAALQNIEFSGNGGSGDTLLNTRLIWNGTNGGTVLLLDRARDSYFSGFSIIPGTGTIGIGIRIDHVSTPSGNTLSSHNIFERVSIGASTTAVQIGNSSTSNNDLHVFREVYISGTGTNGYLINHSQSKWIDILGGNIDHRTNGIQTVAGSFRARGVNFSTNTNDILLGNPTDTILIDCAQSEGAARFLTDTGSDNTRWPVTISNSRLSADAIHADGEYIQYKKGGPLTLMGNDFAGGIYTAAWQLRAASSSTPNTLLVSQGNVFPNGTPYINGTNQTRYSFGNSYIDSASAVQNMAIEWDVSP